MRAWRLSLIAIVLVAGIATDVAFGKRLKDRIYEPLTTAGFCFRRTNGTRQFGCTSSVNGEVGVVHLIETQEHLDWLVNDGPHAPYVAAFIPSTFLPKNLQALQNANKISGALLLDSGEAPSVGYSDDSKCPNEATSMYWSESSRQCSWNEAGNSQMFEDYSFPIFRVVDRNTTQFLRDDCYARFNAPAEDGSPQDWPLCAVQLYSHMYAAKDTETCMRRSSLFSFSSLADVKICDKLGDENIFYFLKERNASLPSSSEEKVLLAVSRLDALSLFDWEEIGADSPVTSIVALLEAARMLTVFKDDFISSNTNILFAFFYGEAFDYIGSSRFVYDMEQSAFPDKTDEALFGNGQQPPLDLSKLQLAVEVGPIFNKDSQGLLFAHTDTQFASLDVRQRLLDASSSVGLPLRGASQSSLGLPPSSLHSLLKSKRDVPAILIADFDGAYSNKYFHSLFDRGDSNLLYNHSMGENQNVVQIVSKTALTLAKFLYNSAGGSQNRDFQSNATFINELLHCYVDTAKCSLFEAASNVNTAPRAESFPDRPYPHYVGPDVRPRRKHGVFTRNLLSLFTGEKVSGDFTYESCKTPAQQNVFEYIFLQSESPPLNFTESNPCNASADCGYCYKTTVFRRSAVSPAFVIDDYDFTQMGRYSTWTESVWKSTSARAFLKASPALEHGHLAVGIIVFAASLVIAYFMDKNASRIFCAAGADPPPSDATTTTSTNNGHHAAT